MALVTCPEDVRKLQRETPNEHFVLQREVAPRLWESCKFDLRVYVLAVQGFGKSSQPQENNQTEESAKPRVFVFPECMARVCTQTFVPGDQSPLANLTNTALNHRKTLGREAVTGVGLNYEDVFAQVCTLVRKTFEAAEPTLERKFRAAGCPRCASILGFDAILDQDGRLWLLEANASPSVAAECALDEQLKGEVLGDYAAFVASGGRERGSFVEL